MLIWWKHLHELEIAEHKKFTEYIIIFFRKLKIHQNLNDRHKEVNLILAFVENIMYLKCLSIV